MSQKSEKYARDLGCRMDKLKAEMKQLRQAQVDSECFTIALHAISNDTAVQRHRAREKDRLAREWRRTAWLAIIAMVLCAALCLTIKVKADADKPDTGITASETVEVKD